MKRSTITLAMCMGLSACSGQSNTDINALNSGKRDAAVDAEQSEHEPDAEPEGEPDAAQDEQDTGASDEQDAGSATLVDAAEPARDARAPNDAGAAASDAGEAGDAAGAANQLRVRLLYDNAFPIQAAASVFFSHADGGLESARTPDAQGLVVSDSAPAMITVVLPGRNSSLDQYFELLTIVAPALGDSIEIDAASERGTSVQTIRYLATVGSAPAAGRNVMAYAGVGGCAQGYQDLVPAPTGAMQIGQRTSCQLESNGSLIAVMRDADDVVLRFAGLMLPAVATSPVAITLDQWLTPEDFTLRLANAPSGTRPEALLWMRKGALTVRADYPDNPPADAIPFRVARSLVDSFEATGWFTRSASSEHMFGKNRPASVTEIALDLNEALPELDRAQLSTNYQPLLRPSASFGVVGGSTPADALLAAFNWTWRLNSDTLALLAWHIVAPANTTSVTVPALPSMSAFGAGDDIPDDAELRFSGVEYYDSDAQSGYRDFLRERLRPSGAREDGARTGTLVRSIPIGGNTRLARFTNGRD